MKGMDDIVKVGRFGTVSVIPITFDLKCFSVISLEYTPLSPLGKRLEKERWWPKGRKQRWEKTRACEAVQ